jgi:regulator of extracellular matrix RemA (YlzA/DUF370 family)
LNDAARQGAQRAEGERGSSGKQSALQAERAASGARSEPEASGVQKASRRRAKSNKLGEGQRGSSGSRTDGPVGPILLNLGYGNLVTASRVVAIVSPQSAPMKRLREEASSRGKLVDATQGRRTRSIIVTDSDHVILSAINPETIAARLAQEDVLGGQE